jgi:hypothetical protein
MPPQQGDSLLGFIDYVLDFRSHCPASFALSSKVVRQIVVAAADVKSRDRHAISRKCQ